ncbi:hypothetical protein LB564_31375 [Mesorhizobium sp. ES1-6]|nr:hypothetical protein [Mesorhizobium sp. ES1-6]
MPAILGVRPLRALCFMSAIEDPSWFKADIPSCKGQVEIASVVDIRRRAPRQTDRRSGLTGPVLLLLTLIGGLQRRNAALQPLQPRLIVLQSTADLNEPSSLRGRPHNQQFLLQPRDFLPE